jgi:DnaJ-class molecular chaperone
MIYEHGDSGPHSVECPDCEGTGSIRYQPSATKDGWTWLWSWCSRCDGEGRVQSESVTGPSGQQ